MDNTLDALRNLYEALGGNADDVENLVITPELINAVAALVNQGLTDALPAVTSEDNGDVLAVVDGAWAKAAPSGGGIYIVNVAYDETSSDYVADKTFAEITAAATGGQIVLFCEGETGNYGFARVGASDVKCDIFATSLGGGSTHLLSISHYVLSNADSLTLDEYTASLTSV